MGRRVRTDIDITDPICNFVPRDYSIKEAICYVG